METIESVRNGKTCIMISHRLSSVQNASKIIILQNGKLLDEGTHLELYNRSGKSLKFLSKHMHSSETVDSKILILRMVFIPMENAKSPIK